MHRFLDIFFILFLAISYVAVYDLARVRENNMCKDDIVIRDTQLKMMMTAQRKIPKSTLKEMR
jgi:hypothetical protein